MTSTTPRPLIYLAGPSVFRPDAEAYAIALLEKCRQYGLHGLYPLEVEEGSAPLLRADSIYRANISRIEKADIVMADLNPFRGQEPDSGTAFELGYGAALGKTLYAHIADGRSLVERYGYSDGKGWQIENFALPLNLMLAVPVRLIIGTEDDCLAAIANNARKPRKVEWNEPSFAHL